MTEKTYSGDDISLGRQSALILAAKVFGFALNFVLPILIVRFLTQDEVGAYRQIFLVIGNALAILPFGMGMSAYYFLSREEEHRRPAVLNIVAFFTVVGGIAFLAFSLYPGLLDRLFRHGELTDLAALGGLVIWVWLISSFLEIVALANREVKIATAFIVFAQLSKAALMIGSIYFFASAEGFLYAAILQGLVQLAVLLYYLRSRFAGFLRTFDIAFLRRHLGYSIPFGLTAILWVLQTDLHSYFVGYKFTPAEYAIYAYGCFQLPLFGLITDSLTSVMIPRISRLQMQGDKREILRITARGMEKMSLLFFPFYVFLLILAEPFIIMLFTREYAGSVPIFIINLTLIPTFVWINDPTIRAFPELGRFLVAQRCVSFLLLMATLLIGIQYFEPIHFITVVIVVALLEKMVLTAAVLKKLGPERSDLRFLKRPGLTAFASAAAGAAVFIFHVLASPYIYSGARTVWAAVLPGASGSLLDSIANAMILFACGMIFLPVYLLLSHRLNLFDPSDIAYAKSLLQRAVPRWRWSGSGH